MKINPNEIPESAQAIAAIIGVEKTMKLAKAINHYHIYIPKKISENHLLIKVLGRPDALKLVAEFRGELLHLPRCRAANCRSRNKQIMSAVRRGRTVIEVADMFKLSRKHVYSILRANGMACRLRGRGRV